MKRLMIVGLVLVMILVSACSIVSTPTPVPPTPRPLPTATPPPTATATPIPTATPTPFPTPANPGASLASIFKTWGNVKSLRAKMTSTGQPTGTQEMTMEVVMPDKFHMTGKDLDMYLIGKVFYMKIANKWQKMTMPPGINFDFANPQKIAATLGAQTDTKFLGAEILDGVPTLVYQYTTSIKGPPAQKYATKVWVGALDNLPRKSESEPKPGQKTTVTFYDYNADIAIKAPI